MTKFNYIFETIIFFSIFFEIYPFLVYPFLLNILDKIFNKKVKLDNSYLVDVEIYIAAYNEEELIEGCLDSIINSNYPKKNLKIYIGSDGSTDNTNQILEKYAKKYDYIKFQIFERSGKNNLLNNLIQNANSEILLFLDADCIVSKDAINILVSNFADQNVGAVLSTFSNNIESDNSGQYGENLYQVYEAYLRKKESSIHSNINSIGSLYGIRKELFRKFPNNKVCDDFYNLLSVANNKKRIIFENNAKVKEIRKKNVSFELMRRVRLVSGGLATLFENSQLLNPKFKWVSFFLFSHKLLRWLSPFFLIFILIFSFALSLSNSIFFYFSLIQLFVYLASIIAYFFEKKNINIPLMKIPIFFTTMNLGFLLGFLRFVQGKQNAIWKREGLED